MLNLGRASSAAVGGGVGKGSWLREALLELIQSRGHPHSSSPVQEVRAAPRDPLGMLEGLKQIQFLLCQSWLHFLRFISALSSPLPFFLVFPPLLTFEKLLKELS